MRGAVPAEPLLAEARSAAQDHLRRSAAPCHPASDSSVAPKLKLIRRVVVQDADDLVLLVLDPRGPVRRITLGRNAVVPVMVRRRRFLQLHRFQPRILARRLVKVAMHADVAVTFCQFSHVISVEELQPGDGHCRPADAHFPDAGRNKCTGPYLYIAPVPSQRDQFVRNVRALRPCGLVTGIETIAWCHGVIPYYGNEL